MKTKQQLITELKTETLRLLQRIEEWEKDQKEPWSSVGTWPAIKRATMDVNRVGVQVRK